MTKCPYCNIDLKMLRSEWVVTKPSDEYCSEEDVVKAFAMNCPNCGKLLWYWKDKMKVQFT